MGVRVSYGPTKVSVNVRGLLNVFKPAPVKPLGNWVDVLKEKLHAFIEGLKDVHPRSALVIIDDSTRPTPTSKVLPALTNALSRTLGISLGSVTVLTALGTHRSMSEDELKRKLGPLWGAVRVVQHNAWDLSRAVNYGVLGYGVELLANLELSSHDIKVGVGTIAPHVEAGWSGGGKIVLPGVSYVDTITKYHMLVPKSLETVGLEAFVGSLNNPLRELSDRSARAVGLDMIVNTVLSLNGGVLGVFAGDPVKAHREGVSLAAEVFNPTFTEEADVVVVSAYPEDVDYWQAMKGELVSYPVVKSGGTIVLLARCPEGLTRVEGFRSELVRLGRYSFKELAGMLKDGLLKESVPLAIAMELAKVREKAETLVVTEGLKPRECEAVGVRCFRDVNRALEEAYLVHGRDAATSVIETPLIAPKRG